MKNVRKPHKIKLFALFSLSVAVGSLQGGQLPSEDAIAASLNELRQAVALIQPAGDPDFLPTLPKIDASLQLSRNLKKTLDDPETLHSLGFVIQDFKATWYLANPFEMLPERLKQAMQKRKSSFRTRRQIIAWLNAIHAPSSWYKAIRMALIETTPCNLWRASRGLAPFAKNGEPLKPVAYQSPTGELLLREGHVATDPRVIPTNSDLLLIIEAGNEKRFVLAKAADTGSRVRGCHIDIPVRLHPQRSSRLPHLRFPKEFGHPRVTVIVLGKLPRP